MTIDIKLTRGCIYSCIMFIFLSGGLVSAQVTSEMPGQFNRENDLLLAHYDFKTDVDDLHSAAAFATILTSPEFSGIDHHAVAGTYGIQDGLYVLPNELMEEAFGKQWSDAHADKAKALKKVLKKCRSTLKSGGNIWIAEGGQSDFTADLVREIKSASPDTDLKSRIHVVQHSDWNEEVTSPDALNFVKENTSYHKIADGNGEGNGTPCFRTEENVSWKSFIEDSHLVQVWELSMALSNVSNGVDGRYSNKAIIEGGFDFSDTAEVSWILGLDMDEDVEGFFRKFGE